MTSWRRVAVVAILFVLAALPVNPVGKLMVAGFADTCDTLFLNGQTIGTSGQARLTSPPLSRSTVQAGSDSVLLLSASGKKAELGMNLRQRVWLPILLLCGLLFAVRLPNNNRLSAGATGALSVLLLGALSIHLTTLWSLSMNFPSVVPLSQAAAEALDLAISLLVLPPSNPYALPIVCATSVLVLRQSRAGKATESSSRVSGRMDSDEGLPVDLTYATASRTRSLPLKPPRRTARKRSHS